MVVAVRKVRVKSVSVASIVITVVLGLFCAITFAYGQTQFERLQDATKVYIECENDARQLQEGSDFLTEQVRMAAMTGESKYIDAYFNEAKNVKSRERALRDLENEFSGTDAFSSLQDALDTSNKLMQTEYYSMRLVCEAKGISSDSWQDELHQVQLSSEDASLSSSGKMARALQLVSDDEYQESRGEITSSVTQCTDELVEITENSQNNAETVFFDIYQKLEIAVGIFVVLMLAMCLVIWKLIVTPLLSFKECARNNKTFPVTGASELQELAETYNTVYEENEERQRLIKHQAEHDALTQLLNRGSYDKMLEIYDNGKESFALILLDVDNFKSVNDQYGHAEGDRVLKRMADLLVTTFRTIDHICRIGGDEFAVIMVEMTPDLAYTIEERITFLNDQLTNHPIDGMPAVSASVGVAFADRANPGDNIFKDADKALYVSKENGRSMCTIHK